MHICIPCRCLWWKKQFFRFVNWIHIFFFRSIFVHVICDSCKLNTNSKHGKINVCHFVLMLDGIYRLKTKRNSVILTGPVWLRLYYYHFFLSDSETHQCAKSIFVSGYLQYWPIILTFSVIFFLILPKNNMNTLDSITNSFESSNQNRM